MIKTIKRFFKGNEKGSAAGYKGVSDFLLRASAEEKKAVFTEAAHKANADQLKVFNEANVKMKTN